MPRTAAAKAERLSVAPMEKLTDFLVESGAYSPQPFNLCAIQSGAPESILHIITETQRIQPMSARFQFECPQTLHGRRTAGGGLRPQHPKHVMRVGSGPITMLLRLILLQY